MCFHDRLLLLFRVNGFRGAGLLQMSSLPGKRRRVSTIAACYPRVCFWLSLAKRQMTDSGRGKEMRSHLPIGRFENAQRIYQTRDIRRGKFIGKI
jgi:hypothetical protein